MGIISIIIPTHNRSLLLERAIKSVLNQSVKFFELIIVDDGSTDDTEEKVDGFIEANKGNYIKYIKIERGGPSAARNAGIKEARGDFIIFLDDDDELDPNFLEIIFENNFTNIDSTVIFSAIVFYLPFFKIKKYGAPRISLKPWERMMGVTNIFPRKIFFDCNIFFDENLYHLEDVDLAIQFYQKNISFIKIDKAFYHCHINPVWERKSLTGVGGKKLYQDTEYFFKKHHSFYKAQGNEAMAFLNYLKGMASAKVGLMRESKIFFEKSLYLSKSPKYFLCWFLTFFGKRMFNFSRYAFFIFSIIF